MAEEDRLEDGWVDVNDAMVLSRQRRARFWRRLISSMAFAVTAYALATCDRWAITEPLN